MTRMTAIALTASLLAGCNATPMPVPVEGSIDLLVGEWAGDFSNSETGRRGSIFFDLKAGRDTASGEVLLIPDQTQNIATAPEWKDDAWKTSTHVLQISFVRCTDGEVDGWIKPYPDPDSGELTHTEFTGLIVRDTLRGRFVAVGEGTGKRRSGTWTAVRIKK